MEYLPTIGLEIHIQAKTKSKMFCSCKADSQEVVPNLNICPVCLGHPGTLPVINKEAVRKTVKLGIALNCRIQRNCYFERKNYFYPDLPKGYQISQYSLPLCKEGYLEINNSKKIRIERVHLEEDTGKIIHLEKEGFSLIDFNRAGIPLIELVTMPDIHSAEEAKSFVKELQLILRYLGISEANMEAGQMRVEVNISLSKKGASKLGTKVEIKNLNSLKSVEKAIEFEIKRQKEILERGEKVLQETRGWSDTKEITFSQRRKESSCDYRYFPDPDLPPLELPEEFILGVEKEISELPYQRRERFKKEYGLSDAEVEVFVRNKDLGEYFEKVISELQNWIKEQDSQKKEIEREEFLKISKLGANYILSELLSLLNEAKVQGEDFLITPENFGEFLFLIYNKKISSKIAKGLLREMFATGKDPSEIIKEKNLILIRDKSSIEKIVEKVIKENPKAVEDYKLGKKTAIQFLIGKAMAETKGRADPKVLLDFFKKKLSC